MIKTTAPVRSSQPGISLRIHDSRAAIAFFAVDDCQSVLVNRSSRAPSQPLSQTRRGKSIRRWCRQDLGITRSTNGPRSTLAPTRSHLLPIQVAHRFSRSFIVSVSPGILMNSRFWASEIPSGIRGKENEKLAPGPSFGMAHNLP